MISLLFLVLIAAVIIAGGVTIWRVWNGDWD
jgi:Flp pilus assembly pilin Flp